MTSPPSRRTPRAYRPSSQEPSTSWYVARPSTASSLNVPFMYARDRGKRRRSSPSPSSSSSSSESGGKCSVPLPCFAPCSNRPWYQAPSSSRRSRPRPCGFPSASTGPSYQFGTRHGDAGGSDAEPDADDVESLAASSSASSSSSRPRFARGGADAMRAATRSDERSESNIPIDTRHSRYGRSTTSVNRGSRRFSTPSPRRASTSPPPHSCSAHARTRRAPARSSRVPDLPRGGIAPGCARAPRASAFRRGIKPTPRKSHPSFAHPNGSIARATRWDEAARARARSGRRASP